MNVGQLIARLEKHDPKMLVLVTGYEEVYDDVLAKNVRVKLVVDEQGRGEKKVSYAGRYDDVYLTQVGVKVTALVIGRQ